MRNKELIFNPPRPDGEERLIFSEGVLMPAHGFPASRPEYNTFQPGGYLFSHRRFENSISNLDTVSAVRPPKDGDVLLP